MSTRSAWLSWTTLAPLAAIVVLAFAWGHHPGTFAAVGIGIFLVGAVLSAVHHAEVVAHRVGEPFGSLLLAVAVTVIEVALIVTLMLGGSDTSALARDTVFAAVMITLNGIAGLSLLIAAVKYRMAVFNPEGAGSALMTVVALATLTLVLPRFTTSHPGPEFSSAQLTFAAVASLGLYGIFVFTQTVKHRDFFLPVSTGPGSGSVDRPVSGPVDEDSDGHADPPSDRAALASLVLLILGLVAVVGLAKVESYPIEDGVDFLGFPHSFVGVVIALLVLLPESIAAGRAAAQNRVQTSLNLAYGSAMASIGLTIPAIAVASIWLDGPLVLGLEPTQMVLLLVSVIVSILTVVPGRSKSLQGFVHLSLLAAFVFLAINP
ncbi:ionic transporter y4hA [Nocardioides sp. Root1257]|uniref:calcium:proton antiporter n=1 Tax=unclassified Nocardioides TaxID=2615069 RepID=UPI000700F04C|nr:MULTISPECIES: calcium:proton antiporter [unclassified Nocardioides]KQW48425.1 ionic transporter y4hA [Nocardioides sp. Root1257]KRC47599.1 ionic transporter y4hA [Nocardioides sp. Root224]